MTKTDYHDGDDKKKEKKMSQGNIVNHRSKTNYDFLQMPMDMDMDAVVMFVE